MTEQPRQSGSELIGELQRWLVRSGARSVSRELSGQIRTVLGGGQERADVWETATADHQEAPECAWCPICRARRRMRESGPGLASGVAAAADAVNVVMQDAMSAFEAAVTAAGRQARPRPEPTSPGEVWDEATGDPATTGGAAPVPPAATLAPPADVPVTDATVTDVTVADVTVADVTVTEITVTEIVADVPVIDVPAGEAPGAGPPAGPESAESQES